MTDYPYLELRLYSRHSGIWIHLFEFIQGIAEVACTDLGVATGNSLQDGIMDEDILILIGTKKRNDSSEY